MAVVVLITSAIAFLCQTDRCLSAGRELRAEYGREYQVVPRHVGIALKRTVCLRDCVCRTYFFVGIAVPHLVKSFLKTSKPLIVIPVCFWGSNFLPGLRFNCEDYSCSTELSISSVTAVLGRPL